MSDLEDLCRVLSSVNGDILQLLGQLQGQASRLLRTAAAAASVRDDEGRPDPGSQATAVQLEHAARQLSQAAGMLAHAAHQGRSFVDRTVGGVGGRDGAAQSLGGLAVGVAFGSSESSGEGIEGLGVRADPATTNDLGPYERFTGPIPLGLGAIVGSRSSQGHLEDCGLVAAVDAVRLARPATLARNCTANANGTYTVRLHLEGGVADVTVSASAPKGAARSYGRASEIRMPSVVTLYEKAIAVDFGKGYGGLKEFPTEHALRLITGVPYVRDERSPGFAAIAAALGRGPVAVESGRAPAPLTLGERAWNQDVVPQHAYAVAGFAERATPASGGVETVIHLVNPWGSKGRDTLNGPLRADELWLTETEFRNNFVAACLAAT